MAELAMTEARRDPPVTIERVHETPESADQNRDSLGREPPFSSKSSGAKEPESGEPEELRKAGAFVFRPTAACKRVSSQADLRLSPEVETVGRPSVGPVECFAGRIGTPIE